MEPLLAFKTRYDSEVFDSNHMSKGLERVSTASTDTAGQQFDLIACHVCHILLYFSALPKPYLCYLIICPQSAKSHAYE